MSKNTKPVAAMPDKTVSIDGNTHEILRTESFKSGGKSSIKSLIAEAVKEKFGGSKK